MYDTFGNYFKKSFRTLVDSPVLFIPTLFNFLLSLIPMMILFLAFRDWSAIELDFNQSVFVSFIFVSIIIIVLSIFIQAGRFAMIKQRVIYDNVSMEDFWFGIKKYVGRIFVGHLLIFAVLILSAVIIVPIIIVMGNSIGMFRIGLMILLIITLGIFSLFISFWQVILVYEDCNVSRAFSLSIKFVKKNFWLVLIVSIIRGIFTENNRRNNKSRNRFTIGENINFDLPFMPQYLGVIGAIGIVISLIKDILTLFFDVLFFEIYHDRRKGLFEDNIDKLSDGNNYSIDFVDDETPRYE